MSFLFLPNAKIGILTKDIDGVSFYARNPKSWGYLGLDTEILEGIESILFICPTITEAYLFLHICTTNLFLQIKFGNFTVCQNCFWPFICLEQYFTCLT
mgnify:CR=1 FL=1